MTKISEFVVKALKQQNKKIQKIISFVISIFELLYKENVGKNPETMNYELWNLAPFWQTFKYVNQTE